MIFTINHKTHYQYPTKLNRVIQSLRITPSNSRSQKIMNWEIEVEGGKLSTGFYDGAGDFIRTLSVENPQPSLIVSVSGEVETFDTNGVLGDYKENISPLAYLRDTELTARDAGLIELSQSLRHLHQDDLEFAHNATKAVGEKIQYIPGSTLSGNNAAYAFSQGTGVCQDQTHILIALARIANIPARYIVGYLHTDADLKSHEASHAWAEIYINGLGWIGFDSTNQNCPDHRYVRLGSGMDALAAAPLRGVAFGRSNETMKIELSITENQQ